MPKDRHAQIKQEYKRLIQNNQVAVYNQNNEVTFGQNLDDKNIRLSHLQAARNNKGTQFMSDNQFYYGIFYPDNQEILLFL